MRTAVLVILALLIGFGGGCYTAALVAKSVQEKNQ